MSMACLRSRARSPKPKRIPRKNSSPLCSLISGITTQRPIVTRFCWPMPNICPRRRKPRYVARSIAWWSFSS
ncbi:transcriptional regulator, TetR family [Burkholderia pseudomallei TSV32]|nr:transcriptional regulator, TetR family [Burkholderia pseudomallei TSV32]